MSDADFRLGPVLEAYIEGNYYWIPFGQIKSLTSQAPASLMELVWLPARLLLITGAEIEAYLPVRYPRTEETGSAELCLARRTEWKAVSEGANVGLGQKLFKSDRGETGILECRSMEFGDVAANGGTT